MKKIICLLLLIVSGYTYAQDFSIKNGKANSSSQKTNRQNNRNPWRVGGGLGLNFGSNSSMSLSVSPRVGYEFVRNLEGGVSVGYQYAKRRTSKHHLFYGGPYLHYYPIPEIFLRTEFNYYKGTMKYDNGGSHNYDENALWVGAGYRQGSGNVHFHVGIEYNVLYKSSSHIFSNGFRPIAGVSIGF